MIADYFYEDVTIDGLLLYGNLINSLLMASAFEGSRKELVHNLASHIVVDETTWHYQYVGIIVLADEMSNLRNPTQTGTNLLVLVQRDADAFTRTQYLLPKHDRSRDNQHWHHSMCRSP